MRKDTSFQYLTEIAKKPARRWSARELATFHAFNPNGICAKKKASDERVREMVNAGILNSGSHYTIGGLEDLNDDPLMSDYALGCIRRDRQDVKLTFSKWDVEYLAKRKQECIDKADAIYAEKVIGAAA